MVVFNENNSLISIKLGNIDNSGNNSSNKNIENKYGNSKFQLKDKMMKQITHKRVNALFKRLGIPFVIKRIYPIELVFGDVLRRLDFVGETVDGELINLEFQTNKVNDADVERFGEYALLLRVIYKKMVHSVVLLTPNIDTENTIVYNINQESSYEMFTVSLKDFKGEDVRNDLIEKINKGIKFSEDDVMDFILTPLMTIDTTIAEFIRENIYLVNKINASYEDIEFIEAMILLEIDNYVQDVKLNEIMKGELCMNFTIVDSIVDYLAENIKDENNLQIANKMLKEGCSKEFILKMTSITEEQYLSLL